MENLAYYSLEEAAERLFCSVAELKDLLLAGNIPFLPGRPVLIAENALSSYVSTAREHEHLNATREGQLEEEYSELCSIFAEVMRQNGDKLTATPLYVRLHDQFKDLPSRVEARRQARIAFLLEDQRQAENKSRKQKGRQTSKTAMPHTVVLKRSTAVKKRPAKKTAAKPRTPS